MTSVLDATIIDDLRALDPSDPHGVIDDVLGAYATDAESRLSSLRTALATGDERRLHDEAHSLKGSSRTIGALALGDLLAEVERASIVDAPAALDRIAEELGRVLSAIAELRRVV